MWVSKAGPGDTSPQQPQGGLEGERPLDTRVADWGMVECQWHVALTPWVPGTTLVGSDGEAGGTDQMWRLYRVSEMRGDPI